MRLRLSSSSRNSLENLGVDCGLPGYAYFLPDHIRFELDIVLTQFGMCCLFFPAWGQLFKTSLA